MAQKVQVLLVDDLDGGEATETVAFSLDGTTYEIDLSSDNATKLRKEFAPYVDHARKASGGFGGGSRAPREARQLYTTTCSNCGNEAQVPFQPRGDKPVYCSDCFRAAPR